MSELTELLAERLETEPRRPSDRDLGSGISATAYWSFDASLEIVVAEAANPPADGAARNAWKARHKVAEMGTKLEGVTGAHGVEAWKDHCGDWAFVRHRSG